MVLRSVNNKKLVGTESKDNQHSSKQITTGPVYNDHPEKPWVLNNRQVFDSNGLKTDLAAVKPMLKTTYGTLFKGLPSLIIGTCGTFIHRFLRRFDCATLSAINPHFAQLLSSRKKG